MGQDRIGVREPVRVTVCGASGFAVTINHVNNFSGNQRMVQEEKLRLCGLVFCFFCIWSSRSVDI